jgi:hypothetical protein
MKKNLNEEIGRIKTLLNIKENNLILEANPILTMIRNMAPSFEARFITGIETKLGKQITNATDTEITTALRSAEMAVIRREIAEAVYLAKKNIIDGVLDKYNMTLANEASAAYTELSAKGFNNAILKDIKNVYKASKTASNNVTTSWQDRLNNLLRNKKTTTGPRYVPTAEDFLDVENLVIAANPEFSASKVSTIVDRVRKITTAKTQEQFNILADTIIKNMSDNLNQPKEMLLKKLWRTMKSNPKTTILGLILFFPGLTAGLSNKALNQFNVFLRTFSPKFNEILNDVGASDPRTNSPNIETPSGGASKYN